MSHHDEELKARAEALNMTRYFWREKGDPTRWVGWESHKHLIPEVVRAWNRMNSSRAVLSRILDVEWSKLPEDLRTS